MEAPTKLIVTLAATSILAGCNGVKLINNGNAGRFTDSYRCSGGAPSYPEPGVMIFTAKKNACNRAGAMGQRSEVIGPVWNQNSFKQKIVLTANISLDVNGEDLERLRSIKGILFQVASMTDACPPAANLWFENAKIFSDHGFTTLQSGYHNGYPKTDANCVRLRGTNKLDGEGDFIVPLDGTPFELRAEFAFKGKGNFDVVVYMNGERTNTLRFNRPTDSRDNEEYALKFGLYTKNFFDYTMTVKNFRVDKVEKLSAGFEEAAKNGFVVDRTTTLERSYIKGLPKVSNDGCSDPYFESLFPDLCSSKTK